MVCMGDLTNTTENNQVCLKYGEKWRVHRRLSHTAVGTQSLKEHRSFQSDESTLLLRDILLQPSDYVAAIERYSCSVVSIIGWGRRIDKLNDQVAQMALAFMEVVNAVIPGQAMMEIMPWLTKLPSWINPWPMRVLAGATKHTRYFYEMTKESAETRPEASFSKRLMQEQKDNGLSWREIGNLTSNLIGGGVDTTSSSMISLILAMCCFPETQRKAQAELDCIVGRSRLPTHDDSDSLPYTTALVAEVLRWRTATVLGGLPHAPNQDDTYQSYHIPKDTWILGNIWAIHRNPRDYPEPDAFRPERFLGGLERAHPNKKGHSAFGWGRRVCSGQGLAEQGIWLVAATVLWGFDIKPGVDDEGNEIPLDIFAYTASENQRPEPFEARFIPRSAEIEKMILDEAEAARERLRRYDGETKVKLDDIPSLHLD
ncbi:hypothetical protein PRZ48_012850 [Zasmidium cellare]|uniref:Cytochrome P450 n=1 Tax=Zasmidium cellare TaxID=395010 RepID=A0ABR0E2E1_ZASCE|nr:hypothetical protein PRZ48_012850 [Zasmidium cellare]